MKAGAARRTIQDEAYRFLHWRKRNGGEVRLDPGGADARARRRLAKRDRETEASIEPVDVMMRRLGLV